VKLVTKAHLEGFYYKPRVDEELLEKYSEGLIATTACLQGKIPRLILSKRIKEAEELALRYQKIYGKKGFYLELQNHPNIPEQKTVNDELIRMSKKLNIPLIATNDSHYVRSDDADAQDILMMINTGADSTDPERLSMKIDDFSLTSPEQITKEFEDTPEAISNTQEIANQCNFEFKLGGIIIPHFEIPGNKPAEEYLRELCLVGLEKKYGIRNKNPEILERLNFELETIGKMGFVDYFLIVQDFVIWAKKNRIVVGPGRGSVAGSITAYALNITNVDPLKYDLLFERFLNLARISMPDIDLDFTDLRRDEVIKYVTEKYGADKVAQIITFGTMASRAVIRDVGRALNYEYSYCDKIAKLIPLGFKLKETLDKIDEFREIYESEEKARVLIDFGFKLEGTVRHASTHACGVVISNEPLDKIVPTQHPSQNDTNIITQYEMHAVEDLGLLKMDFLGLKNLTIIEETLRRIYAVQNKSIDIENLPLDDELTFDLLRRVETIGIFQLESDGMRRYLKQLKPNDFNDIIAMIALYRPGPMSLIPDYIKRKTGEQKVTYIHPKLEPILKNTYGIMIYQEQLMQMAQKLAGFSLSDADVLRKAVGKKIEDLLLAQKEKFVQGCIKNKIEKATAQKLWAWILPFAQYGFNRSHSACYATIAYQTAYLKAHFPVEFMSALLTAEKSDTERIGFVIDECKKMNIEVLPPDINESFRNFSVVPKIDKIRFGLQAIKNVGENVVTSIITERKENGPYKSISDFIQRVESDSLNKKSLESMIKSGVFDQMEERNQLLENMERILEFSRENRRNKLSGQKNLFSGSSEIQAKLSLIPAPPAKKSEKLSWEKELLGLFVSSHPLEDYTNILRKETTRIVELDSQMPSRQVRIGGIISRVKRIITKNGKPMLFANLEDFTGKIELVVFPRTLEQCNGSLEENKVVLVSGKIDNKDNVLKIICDDVLEITEA
ncbi:MAG: DNA polymerase III subunit alpha, partial [Patescibacteria group bacterium]